MVDLEKKDDDSSGIPPLVRSGQSRKLKEWRLDDLELRLSKVEVVIAEFHRARRDQWIGVLVLLVALALSSPQVWGMALAYAAAAIKVMKP